MDIREAMEARHSVRQYTERALEAETVAALEEEISACNRESGLRIQLITEETKAFGGLMARYGSFRGVRNYIALVGAASPDLEERAGYYGERVVLKAQMLGLNTCWVALTYSKRKSRVTVNAGEKLVCVIALGYGANQGKAHKNKPLASLCRVDGDMPDWFRRGMEAALLAPTAINQQKFLFTLRDNQVIAEATGGVHSKVDLGIVKYHFEQGAGLEQFTWAEP